MAKKKKIPKENLHKVWGGVARVVDVKVDTEAEKRRRRHPNVSYDPMSGQRPRKPPVV